jgi:hypothetical protein
MQNTWVRNPPVEEWVETVPAHLRALTATDENAPPQSAYATPEDAQLTGVAGHSMVLVVALHNLPKPCADLTRTMMLPGLKLWLDDLELRHHPLLRRDAPDVKGSAAREIPTEMRESQKREGLGFSHAMLLAVSDSEPPELDQTRLLRLIIGITHDDNFAACDFLAPGLNPQIEHIVQVSCPGLSKSNWRPALPERVSGAAGKVRSGITHDQVSDRSLGVGTVNGNAKSVATASGSIAARESTFHLPGAGHLTISGQRSRLISYILTGQMLTFVASEHEKDP